MCFFFSSRRRHKRLRRDWSSDVCSSDLISGDLQWVGQFVANAKAPGPSNRVQANIHNRTSSASKPTRCRSTSAITEGTSSGRRVRRKLVSRYFRSKSSYSTSPARKVSRPGRGGEDCEPCVQPSPSPAASTAAAKHRSFIEDLLRESGKLRISSAHRPGIRSLLMGLGRLLYCPKTFNIIDAPLKFCSTVT